jgi:hypothetical protein
MFALEDLQQILAVTVPGQRHCERLQLRGVNPALMESNFFRTGNFQSLPVFYRRYKMTRFEQ